MDLHAVIFRSFAALKWLPTLTGILFALTILQSHAAISVQDDLGRTVTLAQPAQRIVSFAPHLTEDLFAIGAGKQIVGAIDYSDYPAAAKQIPRIGGASGVDLERIRSLKPDLLVVWHGGGVSPAQLAKLAAFGIPIFYDNAGKMADIPGVLERLGVLTGQSANAQTLARQFRQRSEQLARQYASRRPVRMFYQIWDRPLMTINGQQIISDAMRLCGAVNVFADLKAIAPTIDEEAVLAANPELIATSGEQGMQLTRWQRWPTLTAVARHQLVILPPDLLSRKGPRFIEGAEALCKAVDAVR